MHILVTGGAGYVGSALVPVLLDAGHQVRVLDQLYAGGQGLLPCASRRNFEFVRGDVCDAETLSAALRGVDAIVHLAAVVGYPACRNEPERALNTNVNGTKLLLGLRRPDQRLVFASTGSVYGAVPTGICTESTPSEPLTLYGTTKLEAEQLVLEAGNCVVYRYATAFGPSPRMRFDLLPNDFVRQAVHDGAITVYEGGFSRTFVHVQDMARSVLFALQSWDTLADDVYNVGNESMNCTKAELAQRIRSMVPFDLRFEEFATDADQRDYEVSYEKIRSRGFTTVHTLDSGLAELVTAARLVAERAN
ncbi:NAD(P)-dependent oxidoreductase [Streptomyces sp. NBC_01275]|uniref:NAD-dependent epimerase/dehydratase family protein n=1 Tax=Streptomyces sp. NBC_01275 TaxID=2903807 RepID=UPI002255B070|nr:NAD(P)-dependent oxidoreductase [Streptomyces sp. NBC_01275]MCX4763827.1 NAD(P)-dependent oxidoreductase [Streptomyces sp. NBC_01275]